jgi:hypothetical protein
MNSNFDIQIETDCFFDGYLFDTIRITNHNHFSFYKKEIVHRVEIKPFDEVMEKCKNRIKQILIDNFLIQFKVEKVSDKKFRIIHPYKTDFEYVVDLQILDDLEDFFNLNYSRFSQYNSLSFIKTDINGYSRLNCPCEHIQDFKEQLLHLTLITNVKRYGNPICDDILEYLNGIDITVENYMKTYDIKNKVSIKYDKYELRVPEKFENLYDQDHIKFFLEYQEYYQGLFKDIDNIREFDDDQMDAINDLTDDPEYNYRIDGRYTYSNPKEFEHHQINHLNPTLKEQRMDYLMYFDIVESKILITMSKRLMQRMDDHTLECVEKIINNAIRDNNLKMFEMILKYFFKMNVRKKLVDIDDYKNVYFSLSKNDDQYEEDNIIDVCGDLVVYKK